MDKRLKKPCPDLPPGTKCPLCGGKYVCLRPERKLIETPSKERT